MCNTKRTLVPMISLAAMLSLSFAFGCSDSPGSDDSGAGAGATTGGSTSSTPGGGGDTSGNGSGVGGDAAGGSQAGVGGGGTINGVDVPWQSDFSLPPQDAAGFSILTPSTDSRIVYVSNSSGNDSTGVVYTKDSAEVGANPNSPSGPVMAFQTIGQAQAQMRSGFPDWMLLERGDVWTITAHIDATSGRSASERSVIGAYGDGAGRPLVRTGNAAGVRFWNSIRYAALVGVAFRAHHRDPNDPDFIGFDNVSTVAGFRAYANDDVTPTSTILIEDSAFSFYGINVVQGQTSSEDIVIRRCLITDNYSTTSHSQGLYTKWASVLLEENLFDHNGWYKQSYVQLNDRAEGQATYFNHNTYFSSTDNTIFRRNLILRASSIGSKFTANPSGGNDEVMAENILLDNNLYVEGEIGVSAGGNTDNGNGHRWRNVLIMNNVLLDIGRSRPTNRSLAWGMELIDWDGGVVSHNHFGHYGGAQVTNIYAMRLQGHSRDVEIVGNRVYGLDSNRYAVTIDGDPKSGIVFSQNELQLGGSAMRLIDSDYLAAGTFSNNWYYADNAAMAFQADGSNSDFAGWQSAVSEPGSQFQELSYEDAGRTVESYMVTQGKTGSLQSFVTEARAQSKQNWRPAYTADAVNAYVRQGYALSTP